MTIHELRLLRLMRSELNEEPLSAQSVQEGFLNWTPEDWNGLMAAAQANKLLPLLLDALQRNPSIPVPPPVRQFLERFALQNSMAYYQKVFLLSSLAELLRDRQVTGYLLKGAGLNALYPREESRSFGDIDLYIPDREGFRRVQTVFQSQGCEKMADSMTDYHVSYRYERDGSQCEVELHYRLTTCWQNGDFDERLDRIYSEAIAALPPRTVRVMEMEFRVLPLTMEALYLLMHMFQHFMDKGFGLRLLLDWTVFWRKMGQGVDCSLLSGWVRELGLEGFLDAVDSICVRHLGMALPEFGWLGGEDQAVAGELLEDVFSGGEFGHLDKNRMVVTARRGGVKAYLMELHRQTGRRFPRASRVKAVLPALWLCTAVIFQYNNLFRRRISLGKVLSVSGERSRLAGKMHIFDES